MSENEVTVKLTADPSSLDAGIDSAWGKIDAFGQGVKNTFSDIQQAIDAGNKTFDTFGKMAAELSSGAVLKNLFSPQEFLAVDDALLIMQVNLKMNAHELDGFREKIVSLAGRAGEDMGALFTLSAKLSKEFKPDDILKIVSASSTASHAMKSDLSAVSERIVQIMKMYHKAPDEATAIAQALQAIPGAAPKKSAKLSGENEGASNGPGYGAVGLSGLLLGGMAYAQGKQFFKNLNIGKTAAGIAEGKIVQAATGVIPVFVTNWPAGGVGGGSSNVPGLPGVGGKFGNALGVIGQVREAIKTGWEIGTELNTMIDAIGGEKGSLGKKMFDMFHGGEAAKGKQVDALLAQVHEANVRGDSDTAKQLLNQIKLVVNIDKDGRVRTDSDDMNTNIDLDRGYLGGP